MAGPGLSSTSGQRSRSIVTRTNGLSTENTSVASKKSSAADSTFERVLMENNIFPDGFCYHQSLPAVQPGNLEQVRCRLVVSRESLSPSRRDPSDFDDFRRANTIALSDSKVMSYVVPFLCGKNAGARVASQENLLFSTLASRTDGATVGPKPDMFDGAPMLQVHPQVRKDLDKYIIPTKHANVPIAPNHFFEAKSSLGVTEEARRQITHDLAAGSRAMHKLQNYEEATARDDGNAYTLGATYHTSGLLKIYTGHVRPGSAGQTETYVNQVRAFAMTNDVDTYYRGVTASEMDASLLRDSVIN